MWLVGGLEWIPRTASEAKPPGMHLDVASRSWAEGAAVRVVCTAAVKRLGVDARDVVVGSSAVSVAGLHVGTRRNACMLLLRPVPGVSDEKLPRARKRGERGAPTGQRVANNELDLQVGLTLDRDERDTADSRWRGELGSAKCVPTTPPLPTALANIQPFEPVSPLEAATP
jgi:hypothetical protein